MNQNNPLKLPTEEAQLSINPEEPSALVDIEASAAVPAFHGKPFEDINHRALPPHPFDTMPLDEAMQASLQAHSVINGMFAPSGALHDRISPHPGNDIVNTTAMRRPAKRATSALVMDPGRSDPPAVLAEAPDPDATISEELSSDRDVGGRQTKAELSIPQARPAKRLLFPKPVPMSDAAVDDEVGPDKADVGEDVPAVMPLRYYCGEPGCKTYRSAESKWSKYHWQAIQSHYREKHENVKFDKNKLITTRSKQRSRAMSPISTTVLGGSHPPP